MSGNRGKNATTNRHLSNPKSGHTYVRRASRGGAAYSEAARRRGAEQDETDGSTRPGKNCH